MKASAESRLRWHLDLPLRGDDEALDSALSELVDTYFDRSDHVRAVVPFEALEGAADWLADDPVSNGDREYYLRIQHWWHQGLDEKRRRSIECTYYGLYGTALESPSDSEIISGHNRLLKRLREEGRELRESKASNLDLSADLVRYYIPWFSVLFVASAYFQTQMVYSRFGVDVGNFFSISDYLAVSVDQLQGALLMAVVCCAGAVYAARTSTMRSRSEQVQRDVSRDRLDLVLKGGLLAAYPIGYFTDTLRLWPLLPVSVLALFGVPITRLAFRYFGSEIRAVILLFTLVVFASSSFASGWDRIREFEREGTSVDFRADVDFGSAPKIYDARTSTLLGVNSQYLFLVARDGAVEIIPLSRVKRMKVSTED